jgi:hypothetical protein
MTKPKRTAKRKLPTDAEIVAIGLNLARRFYSDMGYMVPEGYRFYEARHPQEQSMWGLACIAFEELRDTSLDDALSSVDEDEIDEAIQKTTAPNKETDA